MEVSWVLVTIEANSEKSKVQQFSYVLTLCTIVSGMVFTGLAISGVGGVGMWVMVGIYLLVLVVCVSLGSWGSVIVLLFLLFFAIVVGSFVTSSHDKSKVVASIFIGAQALGFLIIASILARDVIKEHRENNPPMLGSLDKPVYSKTSPPVASKAAPVSPPAHKASPVAPLAPKTAPVVPLAPKAAPVTRNSIPSEYNPKKRPAQDLDRGIPTPFEQSSNVVQPIQPLVDNVNRQTQISSPTTLEPLVQVANTVPTIQPRRAPPPTPTQPPAPIQAPVQRRPPPPAPTQAPVPRRPPPPKPTHAPMQPPMPIKPIASRAITPDLSQAFSGSNWAQQSAAMRDAKLQGVTLKL